MLKRIDNLNESRGDLYNAIIELDPKFANLDKATMGAILSAHQKDTDIPTYKADPKEVVDWFNASDSIGSFIFDFSDDLPTSAIIDLGKDDPKFVKTIFDAARKFNYIDKDGYDLVDAATGGTKHKPTFAELVKLLLIDINKVPVDKNYDKDTPAMELSDETELDPEYRDEIFDELKPIYKSIHEDAEEFEVQVPAETETPAIEEKPATDEIMLNAVKTSINDLIQNAWDYISNINSVIATLDLDYKKDDKDAIIEVLNTIVDDTTISVGMLHKVSNMLDAKESNLLDAGAEKAADIIEK